MGATELWLVRHGESTANIAAAEAEERGDDVIAVDHRDADVALSPLGERQAAALGGWLSERVTETMPRAAWASPYVRAQQTIAIAMSEAELSLGVRVDERLRDRELGVLDLLTTRGVQNRLPAEATRRRWVGKFYYRPPGGESWADVALRVRSFLRDVDLLTEDGCVLIAAHDAVIMLFLYVCCSLDERQIVDFSLSNGVPNASVTRLTRSGGSGTWTLNSFGEHEHLARAGVPATAHTGTDDAR